MRDLNISFAIRSKRHVSFVAHRARYTKCKIVKGECSNVNPEYIVPFHNSDKRKVPPMEIVLYNGCVLWVRQGERKWLAFSALT
jgi:hypothetical protein